MLIWIKDAHEYNGTNNEEVANFIDKHVTCKKDEEIYNLVNYQTHRHARACRKKKEKQYVDSISPFLQCLIQLFLIPLLMKNKKPLEIRIFIKLPNCYLI